MKVADAIWDRGKITKNLGIVKGSGMLGHHIIPVVDLKNNKVVQDAVEAGFDFLIYLVLFI